MLHGEIINKLIKRNSYTSYLEIGIEDTKNNYDYINSIQKEGVDPAYNGNNKTIFKGTSDDYFATIADKKFDIIFIDGLHEHEQVTRDIENSLKYLSKNGTIVVHDCIPHDKEMQNVPRTTGLWTGDVWRAMIKARTNTDLAIFTIDTDFGVGIISFGKQIPVEYNEDITYEEFDKNKMKLLNIITVEDFLKICE